MGHKERNVIIRIKSFGDHNMCWSLIALASHTWWCWNKTWSSEVKQWDEEVHIIIFCFTISVFPTCPCTWQVKTQLSTHKLEILFRTRSARFYQILAMSDKCKSENQIRNSKAGIMYNYSPCDRQMTMLFKAKDKLESWLYTNNVSWLNICTFHIYKLKCWLYNFSKCCQKWELQLLVKSELARSGFKIWVGSSTNQRHKQILWNVSTGLCQWKIKQKTRRQS